ncbi:hypothetical protein [Curtobacterium sp. MCSS17_016]|uniref:hypothetical protein n=1 Tax=Curtobacterium sp. MCSS17_016 TaxID=2175644 RepID=UPI000DA861B1|nr:hypothetical protein [Curtobacterium sp. MCSS17_016]WIE80891.1 hypothetical protein DEJ19_020455 [Curtobacterium sp. MCSS17_016]
MSINTTSALASTDVVDTRATAIANQVLTGAISERDGRWMIVTDILSTDVVFTVARWRRFEATAQEREDLIPEFNELVQRKALQETEGGMDLVRIAKGTSACGWARNLLRNGGMQSELRDMRRITNRNATIDPTLDLSGSEGGVSYADMAFHTDSVTPDFDGAITGQAEANDEMDDLQEEFLSAAAGKRSGARLMLAAETMRKAFKLSAPIRPLDPFDREFVRNTVSEDENAAVESVLAMHALITSVQTEEQRNIDPRMLALWDDYSVDELHRLSLMLPDAAQALVLAAVALKPRPSRDHLATALWVVRHRHDAKGWMAFTKRLFESWVAIEVEAVSEFSSKAPSNEDIAKRLTAALAWPELVAAAVAMDGQPLGKSEREVSDLFSGVLASCQKD